MKEKLSGKERLFIGSLIFGLFFGAGNLIFPIQIGQEAGSNVFQANLGFLVTGIGLPFLGLISFGLSRSSDLYSLASKVGKKYGLWFTTILYLIIGPMFAMPRLASTSFEIGLSPFIKNEHQNLFLLLFSIIFFLCVWYFSRKPSRILDYIGKFLTPLFLILLFFILLLSFLNPLGDLTGSLPQDSYVQGAFFKGFQDGYNTLDALAALAFGMLIIENIQNFEIKESKLIAKETMKSGFVGIVLMGIIYTLLAFLGAMSLGIFSLNKNGGITLAQVADYYLGPIGSVILAVIVIVACLKTAIGLATAFGRTFSELYPNISYQVFTIGCISLAGVIANVGLNQIIALSIPILMFIYPLAMTLIILGILDPIIKDKPEVYRFTTYFTIIVSVFDGLNSLPSHIKDTSLIKVLLNFATDYLPLFNIGMSWIIFAVVGFIFGWLLNKKREHA